MNDIITVQLAAAFREDVDAVVNPWHKAHDNRRRRSVHFKVDDLIGIQYGVEHIAEFSHGVRYNFTITIEGPGVVWLHEMNDLRRRLEVFCNNDADPVTIDGRQYQLGDGDDERAVFFQEGKFKIWLRSWAE